MAAPPVSSTDPPGARRDRRRGVRSVLETCLDRTEIADEALLESLEPGAEVAELRAVMREPVDPGVDLGDRRTQLVLGFDGALEPLRERRESGGRPKVAQPPRRGGTRPGKPLVDVRVTRRPAPELGERLRQLGEGGGTRVQVRPLGFPIGQGLQVRQTRLERIGLVGPALQRRDRCAQRVDIAGLGGGIQAAGELVERCPNLGERGGVAAERRDCVRELAQPLLDIVIGLGRRRAERELLNGRIDSRQIPGELGGSCLERRERVLDTARDSLQALDERRDCRLEALGARMRRLDPLAEVGEALLETLDGLACVHSSRQVGDRFLQAGCVLGVVVGW